MNRPPFSIYAVAGSILPDDSDIIFIFHQ